MVIVICPKWTKTIFSKGCGDYTTQNILPLEMASKYSNFASPPMSYSDFEAKPMVLIIGQYSVEKTSFIRSLVKQDFPGQRIGPEPTTDRFTAIMHSDSKSHLDPQGGRRQSPGQAGPGKADTWPCFGDGERQTFLRLR